MNLGHDGGQTAMVDAGATAPKKTAWELADTVRFPSPVGVDVGRPIKPAGG
jgi:hypothetical protein